MIQSKFSVRELSKSIDESEEKGLWQSIADRCTDAVVSSLFRSVKEKITASHYARIGALSSSLVAFFAGIATARSFAKYAVGGNKFLLFLAPIASLTSIVLDIYSLLFDLGVLGSLSSKLDQIISSVKSNIESVINTITAALSKAKSLFNDTIDPEVEKLKEIIGNGGGPKARPNAVSPSQMIGLSTSLLMLTLVAGASLTGWKVSDINGFLTLSTKSAACAKDLKASVTSVLEALDIKDVTGRTSIIADATSLLKTGAEMRLHKMQEFITDSTLFSKLISFLNDVTVIQQKSLNPELKNVLQGTLVKLDKEYQYCHDIYISVSDILCDTDRQNCVGVIFEGDGGIGKSHYAKTFLKTLGSKLGYGTEIYDMSRGSSKRFNKTYGYQSLGLFNEFAGQRVEEMDYLEDINKILSSDPIGFESANEKLKYQPCQLKLVAFTSNAQTYDFSRAIPTGTNIAMMSRMIRVQVRDKDYKNNRNDPQAHRSPDYGHLECQILRPENKGAITQLSDYWNYEAAPVTTKQLESYIIPILIHHEKQHILGIKEKNCDSPDVVAALDARLAQLDKLLKETPKMDLQYKTTKERKSFLNTSGNGNKIYANATEPAIFHLAGPAGKGKSTAVIAACARLRRQYGMEAYYITHENMPVPEAGCIYVFDDYPFHNSDAVNSYMNFVNLLPMNSIVFLTSNYPFGKRKDYSLGAWVNSFFTWYTGGEVGNGVWLLRDKYWEPIFQRTPGLVRRVGLPWDYGSYKQRPGQYYIEYFDRELPIATPPGRYGNVIDNLCDMVTQYFQTQREVYIFDSDPPPIKFDVEVEFTDLEACAELMGSRIGLASLVAGRSEGKVKLNAESLAKKRTTASFSDWLIPRFEKNTPLTDIALSYANRIRVTCPDITFRFTHDEFQFAYSAGILYRCQQKQTLVTVENGIMHVSDVPVEPCEFAQYLSNPVVFMSLNPDKKFLEMEAVQEYYQDYTDSFPLYTEAINVLKVSKSWKSRFVEAMKFVSTTVFYNFCKLLALLVLTYGVYKLVKKLLSKPIHDTYKNANTWESDNLDNRRSRASRTQIDRNVREKVKTFNWKPNGILTEDAKINKQILDTATQDSEVFNTVINTMPDEMVSYFKSPPVKNAVPPILESRSSESTMSIAIRKIQKNLFKFTGKMNCYGIFVKKDLGLVPCHALDLENGDNFVYWAPNSDLEAVKYKIHIVAYTTVKDLAIIRVPSITAQKDITNLLPAGYSNAYSHVAAYVRPFKSIEICWGVAHYNPVKATPLGDEDQFHPYDHIYYDQLTFNGHGIFRDGDCGLPLIGIVDNSAVLLGIHIAKSSSQEAWFSPLTVEDMSCHFDATKNAVIPNSVVEGFEEHANVPDWNRVLSSLKQDNPITSHPSVLYKGSFKSGFQITPSPDKKCMWFEGFDKPLNFALTTHYSPTLPSLLTENAKSILPKLDNGKCSVLLAQTLKYYQATGMQITEPDALENALFLEKSFFDQYVGNKCRLLRTHEVINGRLGHPLKPLTMTSSAGPYLKYFHHLNSKSDIFVRTNEMPPVYGFDPRNSASVEVQKDYHEIIDCWASGRPVAMVVKDNPKVEILANEDVDAGKVRLFCELDIPLNLALRRYFGEVFNQMALTAWESPWKLAWNPYNFPHYIVKSENPDFKIICIDVKRMDKNLDPFFVRQLCGLVNSCMAESCAQDFAAIAETMSRAIHVQGNIVYTQEGGNHSGSYLTTPLNTVAVHICVLYAFSKRYKEITGSYPSQQVVRTHMTSAGMGDDARFTFHPSLKMSFEYLRTAFLECGLEIVENKNSHGDSNLGELCSRIFQRDAKSAIVKAPLKQDSILKQIHWHKKSKPDLYPQTAEIAIFEASMWDEEFYNKVLEDVKRICNRHGVRFSNLNLASYRQYRDHLDKYIVGDEPGPLVTSTANVMFGVDLARPPDFARATTNEHLPS